MAHVNLNVVQSCLEAISRDSTPEAEALVRFRFLIKEMSKHPKADTSGFTGTPEHIASENERDELARMHEKYAKLELRYNELAAMYDEHKKSKPETLPTKQEHEDSDRITFAKFRDLVSRKLGLSEGGEKGWQKNFLDGSNDKYDWSHITKWRKNNRVPHEVMEDLESLDLTRTTARAPQRWTDAEIEAIREFTATDPDGYIKLKDGHTTDSVAKALTKTFGRYITDGAVKSKLSGLRRNNVVKFDPVLKKVVNA